MKFHLYSIFILFATFTRTLLPKLNPKSKKNIINFGYGINYKYEGILAHFFDRYYMANKFILPSIGDLNFSKLNYNNIFAYLDNTNLCDTDSKKGMLDLMTFCKKIKPFVLYYKRLIKSYTNTAHNILENEINLILPQISRKQKWNYHHTGIQFHRVGL